MASDKVKKGLAAGMLAGLAAVAAAVALAAASPAPAPAEPEVPITARAAAEVRDALAEGEKGIAEPDGAMPLERAGQDAATVPAEPSGSLGDGVPEDRGDLSPGAAQVGSPEPEAPSEERRDKTPAPAAAKERRWVVDYETVWVPEIETVVDVPAHEEPVYETRDVLVCNVSGCGFSTEASADMAAHWRQHALKGVDEGYSSVPRKVQVGTVTIPAETHEVDNGHYERREAGGHWE